MDGVTHVLRHKTETGKEPNKEMSDDDEGEIGSVINYEQMEFDADKLQ